MPQCQFPVFCCFCVSEKLHRKYSWNWTKQKPDIQKFTEASREPKRSRRGATCRPHNRAARPRPWPRPLCVRLPRSTSDAAPSHIKAPRREKPKYPINFLETHHDPPSSSTWDREDPEALPGTLPERGIATGGLLHRWFVSNVSIIFDASCLFLHHLLSVSLHFVAFLCIFRN
jgi:hypothetical protein